MNILTVIPARGGSKGVPRKNIKMLGGKPLIAWTIEAAIGAGRAPLINSDDMEIINIGFQHRALPYTREKHLGRDDTPMIDVVQEMVKHYDIEGAETGYYDDWILLLQPTTPFRTAEDIKAAIELAEAGDCDSVISVVQVGDHHPARMYRITDGYMDALMPEESNRRRQDLSPLYLRNGAIYLTKRDVIMGGRMWGDRVKPYVMPEERSINIDTMIDWKLAEAMLVRD